MKRVTLETIAMQVGISKYSVSRALSGRPGVSPQTRQRVIEVARATGYRHPAVRQQRRRACQDTIVLLIPDRDVDDVAYWMGLIAGASREAEGLGYTFVTRPLEGGRDHRPAHLDRVAGVIVAGSRARWALQAYAEAGICVVLATYPNPLERFDAVHNADHEGGYRVASHLLERGHRRFAFVTEALEKPSFAARRSGLADGLVGVEAHLQDIVVDRDRPGDSFETAYRRLAERGEGPTAVYASTDETAFAVAWALGRLGLRVPGDVSLVGFNDAFAAARFVPRLTTLRAPTRALGRFAMRFLHERLEGLDEPARRLQLAPTLVVRESTSVPLHPAVALSKTRAAA